MTNVSQDGAASSSPPELWPAATALTFMVTADILFVSARANAGIDKISGAFNTVVSLAFWSAVIWFYRLVRERAAYRKNMRLNASLDVALTPIEPRRSTGGLVPIGIGLAALLVLVIGSFGFRSADIDAIFSVDMAISEVVAIAALLMTDRDARSWSLLFTYIAILFSAALCVNFALIPFREPQASQARHSLQAAGKDLQVIYRHYAAPSGKPPAAR